jgi:hypothetical protein
MATPRHRMTGTPSPDPHAPSGGGKVAPVTVERVSAGKELPDDPVGVAVAEFVAELLGRATIELHYRPLGDPPLPRDGRAPAASAGLLPGWCTTLTIRLDDQVARVATTPDEPLTDLPEAALRAGRRFVNGVDAVSALSPAVRRALRDTVAVEFLTQLGGWSEGSSGARLVGETVEYLVELSGSRIESRNPTHGVVITGAIRDTPRLSIPYPAGVRRAKRSPLLFDGQRSVLVVDREGRVRTELQTHRLERLLPDPDPLGRHHHVFVDSGSLVALATDRLGGIGFFLREDRSIWAFVDGRPLVIRRGEHWAVFPVWLATALSEAVGAGGAVELVVQAALMISIRPRGAILAIADRPSDLDGVVAAKDRFDLRNEFDPTAARPETLLHHLIDATDVDAQTIARLAELDGATVVDRQGRLLAYGAIVSSADSEHEGARTAAARSLSQHAVAVLKVSEDGDITVFRGGEIMATLLPSGITTL